MGRAGIDRMSTRLNSSHANIFTLSLHDALPICHSINVQMAEKGRSEAQLKPDCQTDYQNHLHGACWDRSDEHTSELQSRQYLHSFPTRRSSDLSLDKRANG